MEEKVYQPNKKFIKNSRITNEEYLQMYQDSVQDPESFWDKMGKSIDWIKPYDRVKNTSFSPDNIEIKWYEDGFCLLYTSPSPRDGLLSRMPSSA